MKVERGDIVSGCCGTIVWMVRECTHYERWRGMANEFAVTEVAGRVCTSLVDKHYVYTLVVEVMELKRWMGREKRERERERGVKKNK